MCLVYGTGVLSSMTPFRYFFASSIFMPFSILQTSLQFFGETAISLPIALEVVSGSVVTVYPMSSHLPHFSGMNLDDLVAPTPRPECLTDFLVSANSPR